MQPRDAIIVAAVVLIGGFAAADAIRGRAEQSEVTPTTSAVQTTPTRLPGPRPQPEAPPGWPTGLLQGSLVFTDADDCRVRAIGLAGGTERPLSRFAGDCQLWAAPVTNRVAYGLGPTTADGFSPFRIADLNQPNHELGGYRALFGVVLWSPDAQRIAWCGRRRVGFDLEVGGPVRRLPTCPVAYTADGAVAYAIGNRLVVEGRTVLRASGGITYVHYGTDGSLAIVIDGRFLERWEGGSLMGRAHLPASIEGRTPILRSDNCAALFAPLEDFGQIDLLGFPCFPGEQRAAFFGTDAAWSPDGQWIAVAERETIAFHRVVGGERTVRWPAAAAELAWRPR